jgi:hypothetical protein
LFSGLIGGFSDRLKVGKTNPNQGIKLSCKDSLIVFLVTWLTAGLKKIGGGYIFIHRMLLEHFADLPTQAALKASASDVE